MESTAVRIGLNLLLLCLCVVDQVGLVQRVFLHTLRAS